MVPSRHAQKAARRGDGSPSPTGPRERDTKGANDAKQRRKVEPADLDAARAKAVYGASPLATDAASTARERQLEGAARAVRRTRLRKILVRWLAAAHTRRRERDGSQFRVKLRPGAVVSGSMPLASMVGIGRDPIAVLGLHRPTRSGLWL